MTAPGSTIGPYVVERELGRGGMGVVLLARDPRLDRLVAIKALPPALAADGGRLERFEREARTLASLNHPCVGGILAVEEHEGGRHLVLEFVEGESLADRLDRGPMPLEDALPVACDIAAGMEAAHEAGVVHRDLKPANIMLTPDGRAKVLDFGLARGSDEPSSSAADLEGPTLTTPVGRGSPPSPTMPGAILGTAAYMSPEQARGRRVDRRTDIWAFGVILHEMLTGRRMFGGETMADSLGAVLHKDLDLGDLPAGTPRRIVRLVHRCVERDRERRLQWIGDARVELEDVRRGVPASVDVVGSPTIREARQGSGRASRWLWPAATVCLAGLLAAAMLREPPPVAGESATVRPAIVVSELRPLTEQPVRERSPALSPDGREALYAVKDGEDFDIILLRVGGSKPINLTADFDGDDWDPAFSPDGERIAFVSDREGGGIFVMGATGENPRRVTDSGFDPAWSPDGTRLVFTSESVDDAYARTSTATLSVVDVADGTRTELTAGMTLGTGGSLLDCVGPAWSPDGRWIAAWGLDAGIRDLHLVAADGSTSVQLTHDTATDWNPMWSAGGRRLLYISDRLGVPGVWSLDIDPATGAAIGAPRPVIVGPAAIVAAAVAADGRRMVMLRQEQGTTIERVAFDPEREVVVRAEPEDPPRVLHRSGTPMMHPAISHDGTRVAFYSAAPREDIVTMRLDGTERRRLTRHPARDRGPNWFPGDERLAFYSNRDGDYGWWAVNADATQVTRLVSQPGDQLTVLRISPDGRTIISEGERSGDRSLRRRTLGADGSWTLIGDPIRNAGVGNWSPDGRRLSLGAIDETGTYRPAIHDLVTGETRRLGRPGEPTGLYNRFRMEWLDADRVIFWLRTQGEGGGVVIGDATTGEIRPLPSLGPGPIDVFPVDGGTALVLVRRSESSDLWTVDLADGADGAEDAAADQP